MARYTSAKSRDGAVQDYLQLRAARDRSIGGRRALAAAEASLAEELRAAVRSLGKDQWEAILQDARERLAASLADDDDDFDTDPTSPAKSTPTPTPKPTSSDPTGWHGDTFTASRSQLRDPNWCLANQASLVKAGGKLVVTD